ncbi:hypothetical protein Plhal304r1_c013g0049901 [Plasmopara halstedii]
MWNRFGLFCLLIEAPIECYASSAAHLTMMVSKESTASSSSSNTSMTPGTVSPADTDDSFSTTQDSDSNSDGWHMKAVTSIQARVQGDAPVWNKETKRWLSKYGDTAEAAYRSNLDTVNTASVEGALMFVQAEGINVIEQSVKCERKNNMQYIVFYEITIVQPTNGIKFYEKHTTPEYGEFVAMDGGKCTDEGSDLSTSCKVYYGLDGEPKIGPMVGSNLQTTEPRAPYPGNYWFSYPGSCAQKLRADKTDECRAEYPGGLCAMGDKPDGENCTFSYKILGYLNIDDLVGITEMNYGNYTDFCEDGGIEFKAINNGSGFEVSDAIDFWKDPCDENANVNRTSIMVKMYNEIASSNKSANMEALPTVENLTSTNPKCYENSEACATAQYGCNRTLYSQVCTVCTSNANGCEAAPSNFSFPKLTIRSDASSDSTSSKTSDASSSNRPIAPLVSSLLVGLVALVASNLL